MCIQADSLPQGLDYYRRRIRKKTKEDLIKKTAALPELSQPESPPPRLRRQQEPSMENNRAY